MGFRTLIVVDTSALVSILIGEAEAEGFQRFLALHTELGISTATWLETTMVCHARLPAGLERLEKLADVLSIKRHPFDIVQSDIATEAFRRYGRGSGSRAGLNLGDCFSYALAKSLDAPLLFKGDDFVHTDIRSALAP